MAWKRYTAEQIIGMLREAEVRLSQGEKTGQVCRSGGIGADILPVASGVWRPEGRPGETSKGVREREPAVM